MRNEVHLKCSGSTGPQELAGRLAQAAEDGKEPIVRAIGAGAVNQALKAFVVANTYLATGGQHFVVRPGFQTVQGDSGDVSAMTMRGIVVKSDLVN